MKRRDFLKTSAVLSVLSAAGATPSKGAEAGGGHPRELYELRQYRLRDASDQPLLDGYLEKALIPAMNRLGIQPVGAFVEQAAEDGPAVHLLIPHASPDSFAGTTAALCADAEHLNAGAEYLEAPKSKPAFERMDSWLLLAFAGMPRIEQPQFSRERKPRLFELRTYESHSESKALKKVEMFNSGEIQLMRDVGLGPVFFGQGLAGDNLPHLTYMLSAEDMEQHKAHWDGFVKHPSWEAMKNDPQYKDTVSRITKRILIPTAYSQI